MWLGIISSATMLLFAMPAFADSCVFSAAPPDSRRLAGGNCRKAGLSLPVGSVAGLAEVQESGCTCGAS
jgi:hypothetical protein